MPFVRFFGESTARRFVYDFNLPLRVQTTNEKVKVVLLLPLFTSSSKRLAPVLPSRSEKLSRNPFVLVSAVTNQVPAWPWPA